jgi:Lon protease-like protein
VGFLKRRPEPLIRIIDWKPEKTGFLFLEIVFMKDKITNEEKREEVKAKKVFYEMVRRLEKKGALVELIDPSSKKRESGR